MRLRQLGKTGIHVSELALGTWGLAGDGYGPVTTEEQDAVIKRARALGITLFDTADSYGRGAMESRLGRLLGNDAEAHFVTRIGTDLEDAPPRKRFDQPFLRQAVERCRERQRRDILDVVLLHNPSTLALDKDQTTQTLSDLRESGTVRAWGVSTSSAAVARKAVERGAQVIALPCNAFHTQLLRDLSYELTQGEVGVLAHSVLAYGLLSGLWSREREFTAEDHRSQRWTREELRQRIRQLDALRPVVHGAVRTMRGGALRYVLTRDEVSSAVVGPRSCLQLDQLVRDAGKGPPYLTKDQLTALEARLREVGVDV